MMKLNSECLNITSLSELDTFIKEYESLLVNISYHYSKIKIHYTESYFSNESADSNETSAIYEANNSESVALIIAIIKISLYAIMILVGLVGNVLIILVICLNKFMKNSTNYFILNLAICDLAIIFSCVWIQIFLVLSENWLLGEIFCKVNSYMQMVSLVASVLSLSAVSCNRYFGIMHPLRAKTASGKSYVFIIPIIWTISLIVSLPSFIYRTYREVKWSDYTVRTCDDFGWPVELVRDERNCPLRIQTAKRFYYTTVILFLFFLPIFIMSITYSFITKKLWTNETVGEIKVQMNRHSKGLKKRKKVIIMLVWILIVFFLCWCPLEIILLFTEYAPNYLGKLSFWSTLEWISYFLAYSNTAINPILYAGLNENYKRGIRNLGLIFSKSRDDDYYKMGYLSSFKRRSTLYTQAYTQSMYRRPTGIRTSLRNNLRKELI